MSGAWARLVNSHGMVSEVEWVELVNEALAEVQIETLRRAERQMNGNDTFKIKAAAFAVRAGHTDEMAQALVEELGNRGHLGMPDEYGPTLADLMRRAAAPDAREKLVRAFERHASSHAALSAADEILGDHRRELAAKVRGHFNDSFADAVARFIEADE